MNSKVNIETIIVTGAAGFIGAALTKALLDLDFKVIGIDNLNDYYSTSLKRSRLSEIEKVAMKNGDWLFYEINIEDYKILQDIINKYNPQVFVHLAAQAGVRYSIINPAAYIQSNLVGFANVLEGCRQSKIPHLIYASSSSVYGGNKNLPFYEEQAVNHPVSLYAATKKSNELMAHTYSHLYGIPSTGLRFFTVYGPWGRPDMALFIFTKAILNGDPINVFNNGHMIRDFTYVDDIAESLMRILDKQPIPDKEFDPNNPNPSTSWAPHRIFNIGNSNPTPLIEYINAIERELGISAKKNMVPIQPGDVPATSSDSSELEKWINFKPNTSISYGVSEFVKWYKKFYEQ